MGSGVGAIGDMTNQLHGMRCFPRLIYCLHLQDMRRMTGCKARHDSQQSGRRACMQACLAHGL